RKYVLAMIIAQQGTFQSEGTVLSSILANVGSLWSFRVGPEDEAMIGRYFDLPMLASLTQLANYNGWARLMIDGKQTPAFSVKTIPP
ncbi:MAG: type VI secretion protein, partial [Pseudomonadota bacterium]